MPWTTRFGSPITSATSRSATSIRPSTSPRAASGSRTILWQTDVAGLPERRPTSAPGGRAHRRRRTGPLFVEVAALAAQDDFEFGIDPGAFDRSRSTSASLTNANNADIDVVGRLVPDGNGGPPTWSRIRESGTRLTFCLDDPHTRFDLIYVVLSNHGRARSFSRAAPMGTRR